MTTGWISLRFGYMPLCLAPLLFQAAVRGQTETAKLIVLPADKFEVDVEIPSAAAAPIGKKKAQAVLASTSPKLQLVWPDGKDLSPQPIVTQRLGRGALRLHFSELYFWGAANLNVRDGSKLTTYPLQRGPGPDRKLQSEPVSVWWHSPSALWLYNYQTAPLPFQWRIVADNDSICGERKNGEVRRDCEANQSWGSGVVGARRSDQIRFTAPDAWFDLASKWRHSERRADLELRFGTDDAAPLQRVPLRIAVQDRWRDRFGVWIPEFRDSVSHAFPIAARGLTLLWNLIWVTVGAMGLMLAQVMAPNFRRILRVESQIDDYQSRLRALGSNVGSKLYTRCDKELSSLRGLLGSRTGSVFGQWWSRLLVSGNTGQVDRAINLASKIDARVRLTERLDEILNTTPETELPVSLHALQEKQIRLVREILARQLITESEAKTASVYLDDLQDPDPVLKTFSTHVETRILVLRRKYSDQTDQWRDKVKAISEEFPDALALVAGKARSAPNGGWHPSEICVRDLNALRLELIYRMVEIEPLLVSHPRKQGVQDDLRHPCYAKLDRLGDELLAIEQGTKLTEIEEALNNALWDVVSEPASPNTDDVIRVSFIFRDKRVDQSAVKDLYACWWKIETTKNGDKPDLEWYPGWQVQFMRPFAEKIDVTPQLYDQTGAEVDLPTQCPRKSPNDRSKPKDKYPHEIIVKETSSSLRIVRGLLDAAFTALVPVATVALSSFGQLTIDKLMLLGFTSQAIRAAVVPESVNSPQLAPKG